MSPFEEHNENSKANKKSISSAHEHASKSGPEQGRALRFGLVRGSLLNFGWRILRVLLIAWLTTALGSCFLANSLTFHPSKKWNSSAPKDSEERQFVNEEGVQLSGLWLPAQDPKGVILFCHGNAGNLSDRIPRAKLWRDQLSLSVFLFDYQGYGKSEGSPSEARLYQDTTAAYLECKRLSGEEAVIFGRSLGTAAAVQLAADGYGIALILDSPLESAAAMARHMLPIPFISYFIGIQLNSIEKIQNLKMPLLVFHGSEDKVIPLQQGKAIFDAATCEPKNFIILQNVGHNDNRSVGVETRISAFVKKHTKP